MEFSESFYLSQWRQDWIIYAGMFTVQSIYTLSDIRTICRQQRMHNGQQQLYICKHHLGLEQVNWPRCLLPPSLKLAHTIVILSLNTIRIIYLKLTHYSAVWLNCGISTWCVQSIWFSVLLIMILWNESIMSECAEFDNFVTNYGAYMQIWKQAFANFTAGKIKFRRDTSLNTSQDNNCITVSDILPIYRIKL